MFLGNVVYKGSGRKMIEGMNSNLHKKQARLF